MTPDDLAKFATALRSSQYKQICWTPNDRHGGYCAIGLARHLEIQLTERERSALVFMNHVRSFPQIADEIEGPDLTDRRYLYHYVLSQVTLPVLFVKTLVEAVAHGRRCWAEWAELLRAAIAILAVVLAPLPLVAIWLS